MRGTEGLRGVAQPRLRGVDRDDGGGTGDLGKAIGSFYYLAQYMREQSQTVVE